MVGDEPALLAERAREGDRAALAQPVVEMLAESLDVTRTSLLVADYSGSVLRVVAAAAEDPLDLGERRLLVEPVEGLGGDDGLTFDGGSSEVLDTGNSLTAGGIGSVVYDSVESVEPFNASARIVDKALRRFAAPCSRSPCCSTGSASPGCWVRSGSPRVSS